jgi:hypothetical protein
VSRLVPGGDEGRSFVTADVPVSSTIALAVMGLLGWSVLVLLGSDGGARLAALASGAPVVVGLAWLVSPPRTLWIEDDALVVAQRWRTQRLPVPEIGSVRRNWIPYKGYELEFVGRDRSISLLTLDRHSEPLRHELGRRVVRNGPSVLEDPVAGRLLGVSG